MGIAHEGCTHTGRRDNNEDALLAAPELGLFAVADGMGGYEGGEVASETALAAIRDYGVLVGPGGMGLQSSAQVAQERAALAVRIAHREVASAATGALRKMGTTLACLTIEGAQALVTHVGDSRVYRLREGDIECLTLDHSLHAMMAAAGVSDLPSRREFRLGNVITQAIGRGRAPSPDFRVIDVLDGDRFLLCTDGISDVLDDDSLAWLMSRTRGAAGAIVEAAYEAGSTDNLTALCVWAGASRR